MSKCHRCVDCPQRVEHDPDELCPSCGRCAKHCDQAGHEHMKPTPAAAAIAERTYA